MGEAKEVEGLRFIAGSSIPRWPPEAHQPRFLSIDLQPETSKPLRDHPLDFMNILQSLETHRSTSQAFKHDVEC
jgi:hypothetical protein